MTQHILIVEDDEMIQSFLALHLKNEGFQVSLAGSGKEMSRALGQADIDLIVLDLGLPDGDGLTLAQEVRSRSSIPIIIATARKGADDRIMALGLGADDYVTKPYDPRELVLRIRNVLSRVATGAAAASPSGTGVPPATGRQQPAVLLGELPSDSGDNRRRDDVKGDRRNRRTRGSGLSVAIAVATLAVVIAGGTAYWTVTRTATDGAPQTTTQVVAPLQTPEPATPEPAPVTKQAEAPAAQPATPAPTTQAQPSAHPKEKVTVVNLENPQTVATPPPEEDSTPKPMAEVLGYGWVLETKCDPIPQVEWWKFKTHEDIAGYVTRKYESDWTPYIEKWTRRLVKLQDIYGRGSSAVTNTDLVLKGAKLSKYVEQTRQRVMALRCMAKEATAYNASKAAAQ